MKKINRFKDPFLHGAVIDSVGYLTVLFILGSYNCFEDNPLSSILLCATLLGLVLFRAMFTSVSFSMLRHLKAIRNIVFNINVDIKITKLYVRVFGPRKLYATRARLLREKKKHAKIAYKNTVKLVELMWKDGYKMDLLVFTMNAMLRINNDVSKLAHRYRRKTRKRLLDKNM